MIRALGSTAAGNKFLRSSVNGFAKRFPVRYSKLRLYFIEWRIESFEHHSTLLRYIRVLKTQGYTFFVTKFRLKVDAFSTMRAIKVSRSNTTRGEILSIVVKFECRPPSLHNTRTQGAAVTESFKEKLNFDRRHRSYRHNVIDVFFTNSYKIVRVRKR